MKRSLYLLIAAACLMTASASGRQRSVSDDTLYKLHYTNSGGERGVTTFFYNSGGRLEYSVWELLDGTRFSLNTYDYDQNGNMIRKFRTFSEGRTSTQLFVYEQGRNTLESYERSDGITGYALYSYDDNGSKVIADCRNLSGWITGSIAYDNGSTGRPVSAIIEREGRSIGSIDYTYDSAGRLVREYWDFGGSWNQTFIYEYRDMQQTRPVVYLSSNVFIHPHPGCRLQLEEYTYNNDTGGPSYFYYDPDGTPARKLFVRSDGLYTETVFLYGPNGVLEKSFRSYSNGRFALFSYAYNESGALLQRRFCRSDSLQGGESYSYDERGRLVAADYDKMDSWLNGTITFASNEHGLPEKGVFTGRDGFDADILFTYDEEGKLLGYRWDFSFGTFQEYRFRWGGADEAAGF
ncbi:hypothetical protein JXO52_13310 [bacterium]|nr:hypothetical protein [bacterium]